MFKFRNYPIYIIYSRNWQRKVELTQLSAFDKIESYELILKNQSFLDFARANSLKNIAQLNQAENMLAATYVWDLEEDNNPKYKSDIRKYEHQINQSLIRIAHTRIGQMLLNSINAKHKVYIIPLSHYTLKYKGVTTGPYSEAKGGGIRIQYNPDEMKGKWQGSDLIDGRASILFHELVHVSRKSNGKQDRNPLPGGKFPTMEEFIATQFENIFIETTKSSTFYSLYDGGYAKKDEAYDFLINNRAYISALKNLLMTEPLAQQAALLVKTKYNPFRDFKELEEASNKKFLIDL